MDRRSSADESDHDRDGHRADESADEGGDGADEPDEAARLQALVGELRAAERYIATAVLEASEVEAVGVAERVTGQPLSFALGVACRLTGADRATLLAAGDVLDNMPTLRGWFADGHVRRRTSPTAADGPHHHPRVCGQSACRAVRRLRCPAWRPRLAGY